MFFDASKEESVDFSPLPTGLYTLTVVHCEQGPTANGSGAMVKVEYAVEGQGERKVFDNFNIKNQSAKAEQIGRGQFKHLLECVGRPQLKSPSDLLGARVRANISHREYNGNTYANVQKYIKLGIIDKPHQEIQQQQPQQNQYQQPNPNYQQPMQQQPMQQQPMQQQPMQQQQQAPQPNLKDIPF